MSGRLSLTKDVEMLSTKQLCLTSQLVTFWKGWGFTPWSQAWARQGSDTGYGPLHSKSSTPSPFSILSHMPLRKEGCGQRRLDVKKYLSNAIWQLWRTQHMSWNEHLPALRQLPASGSRCGSGVYFASSQALDGVIMFNFSVPGLFGSVRNLSHEAFEMWSVRKSDEASNIFDNINILHTPGVKHHNIHNDGIYQATHQPTLVPSGWPYRRGRPIRPAQSPFCSPSETLGGVSRQGWGLWST